MPRCCQFMAGRAAGRWHACTPRPATRGRLAAFSPAAGQFDDAIGKFALAYADQADRDHAALKAAMRAGIVDVQLEH
jgi:hypothetical protein